MKQGSLTAERRQSLEEAWKSEEHKSDDKRAVREALKAFEERMNEGGDHGHGSHQPNSNTAPAAPRHGSPSAVVAVRHTAGQAQKRCRANFDVVGRPRLHRRGAEEELHCEDRVGRPAHRRARGVQDEGTVGSEPILREMGRPRARPRRRVDARPVLRMGWDSTVEATEDCVCVEALKGARWPAAHIPRRL